MKSLLSFFGDLKEIGQDSQTLGEFGAWGLGICEQMTMFPFWDRIKRKKKKKQGLILEELQPPFSKPFPPLCQAPPLCFSLL